MVIPEGYKQTEVGIIPEDWDTIAIADVADVKTGPFGSALHANDYVESGVPIITVEHLGETGITRQNLPLVSIKDAKRLSSYMMYQGDIVFSRVGSVDRNAFVTSQEDGWLFSGRILRIRTKSEKLNPQFLSYYFKSEPVKYRIRAAAVGQTMASLNTKIMNAFTVAVPTALEQQPIADVLSDIDALITSYEKQLAKKRAIKRGAMQELLTGKRRLPGFTGEWNRKLFSDVCEICAHMVDPAQKEYANLPHIGNESIEKFSGRITHYNIAKDDQLISGKYLFGCNDVLYGKINPHFAKAAFPKFEGLCSADMYPISCKVDILPEYLLYVLLSSEFTNYTVSLSKRSGIPKVNRDELADYVMLLPSLDEQKKITGVLCSMDAEIDSLIQILAKYHQVKQGMMQQLLTGKNRLTDWSE